MNRNELNQFHGRVIRRKPVQTSQQNELKTVLPNLPMLGQIGRSELLTKLLEIIQDEATATEFYTRLASDATDPLHKEFIEEAAREEKNHLMAFTSLYEYLAEQSPTYQIVPERYIDFKNGVMMALKDELEAADLYKEMTLKTTDAMIKDIFFYAMGDELEHAIMFSTIHHML